MDDRAEAPVALPRGCPKKGAGLAEPGWFWIGEAVPDKTVALDEDAAGGGIAGMDMAPS